MIWVHRDNAHIGGNYKITWAVRGYDVWMREPFKRLNRELPTLYAAKAFCEHWDENVRREAAVSGAEPAAASP